MDVIEKKVKESSIGEIQRVFELQSSFQYEYANQDIHLRYARLKKLMNGMQKFRGDLRDAVFRDFHKHATEVDATEILPTIVEIRHAMRNLNSWTKSKKVATPISMVGSSSKVIHEAKGVSLIIAPWNFPILLALTPLVGAIAAGCPVIIKPSENTGHTSQVLDNLISDTFDEREVAVLQGGIPTSTALLDLPFKHIFFTGSPAVGKIIMKSAAKHLTSVTLELGGKSPVIVDESANLKKAAKRITWGKLVNGGQVCVAPDYLLVHESVKEKLVGLIKEQFIQFYGENPQKSESYTRIVNAKNFERLNSYLKDAVENDGKFEIGGRVDASEKYVEPTIISNLKTSSEIMQEEIFGPILPVITFKTLEEVPKIIQDKEVPLALYIFSSKRKNINFLIRNTRAGGTVVNHVVIHNVNPNLPFGGLNNSGIGKSHGKDSFLEFTNQRAFLEQKLPWSATDFLTPPYTALKARLVRISEKWLS